jgi:hypothetical protein
MFYRGKLNGMATRLKKDFIRLLERDEKHVVLSVKQCFAFSRNASALSLRTSASSKDKLFLFVFAAFIFVSANFLRLPSRRVVEFCPAASPILCLSREIFEEPHLYPRCLCWVAIN